MRKDWTLEEGNCITYPFTEDADIKPGKHYVARGWGGRDQIHRVAMPTVKVASTASWDSVNNPGCGRGAASRTGGRDG